MELVEGETLAQRLMKGALPLADVVRFGGQIADALDRAHRAGVMHRDLKPGNVMLTKSGAKLMDFGLARATGLSAVSERTSSPTVAGPLTAEGTILGTFQYMAPEQLEGQEADARADLWALGCVLYEMATGKRAFDGKSQASLITAIMGSEPAPISQLSPLAPPALDRLVGDCLAKDPAERIQSTHDVKLQLQWIAAGGSQTGVPAPVATRRKGREALAWSLLGAIAILAVVMAVRSPWGRSGTGAADPLHFSLSTALSEEAPVAAAIASLHEAATKSLAGTEGASSVPAFSPDGKWLVFTSHNRGLKKIPSDGGTAVDLVGLGCRPFPERHRPHRIRGRTRWSAPGHAGNAFGREERSRVRPGLGPGRGAHPMTSLASGTRTLVPEAGLEPARPYGQGILRQRGKGGESTNC